MNQQLTRLGKFVRKYWRVIVSYLYLSAIFLLGLPYAACRQPEIFLTIASRAVATLFIGGVVLAIGFGLISYEFRKQIRSYLRLIGTLKYSLIFGLLLVYLPLTACDKFPLHSLLGSLFVELDPLNVLIISSLVIVAMWSLAFTQGVTIDSVEARYNIGDRAMMKRGDHIWEKGYIPKKAYEFFNSDIRELQLGLYTLLSFIGIGIITLPAEQEGSLLSTLRAIFLAVLTALAGLFLGLLFVYFINKAIGRFIRPLYEDEYTPLPKEIATSFDTLRETTSMRLEPMLEKGGARFSQRFSNPLTSSISRFSTWQAIRKWGHEKSKWFLDNKIVKWVYNRLGAFFYALFPAPEHLAALLIGLGLFLLFNLYRLIYPFNPNIHPLPYLYVLIITLIFFISGLDFQFARIRIPFLPILILCVYIGYNYFQVDYFYPIERVETPINQALKPVEVARGSQARENLVIVASTGGGIWASGWTTAALKGLITERPELLHEIRLLSTVSGGTLGAAYFIHDLCHAPEDPASLARADQEAFMSAVFAKSVTSSLSATTYGFAYYDLVRFLTFGIIDPVTNRGLLQEQEWAYIANDQPAAGAAAFGCETDTMLGLRQAIARGNIPAPIFNATALESGRRVMITPINFTVPRSGGEENRGDTLTDLVYGVSYVGPKANHYLEADISLWTAARLSAAFPYVTPAARVKMPRPADQASTDVEPTARQPYHLIDGGYYDNFGVASALDWLGPVLEAREQPDSGLEFSRVAIIELRAFPVPLRNCYEPQQGFASAVIGPPVGLYNIRTGSAFSRNEIELLRFMNLWRKRLGPAGVQIERFVFQPPLLSSSTECKEEKEIGALSWHLTKQQINSLTEQWLEPNNTGELAKLTDFLQPKTR